MIWALIVIFSCMANAGATGLQATPTSLQGNVEAVCQYITDSLSSYGEKFIRYPLPTNCRDYQGVGEQTLRQFFLQDSNCYKDIASSVCAVQFMDYEPSYGCKNTSDFFFKLLATCKKNDVLSSTYAYCATFDPTSKTIGDPESFCKNSHLKIDEGSDSEDNPLRSTVKTFKNSEMLDCKRLVSDYNVCMLVPVGKLGYTENFCYGGGFSAYCQKYPTTVKDVTFKIICQNLVIPYIMEMNQQFGRRMDYCENMYTKYLLFLSTRKADMLLKAKAAKDSLMSALKPVELLRFFNQTISELKRDNENLDSQSTILLNQMRQLSEQNMSYYFNIKTKFQNLLVASAQTETNIKSMNYTHSQAYRNLDEKLEGYSTATPSIQAVIISQKAALTAVQEIKGMIDAGSHVAHAGAYGFYPIQVAEIEAARARIKELNGYIQPFALSYLNEIQATPESAARLETQIRNDGKKYSELADIYAAQTALLVKYQHFGSQSGSPVIAAMSSALKSAEEKAKAAYP